MKWMKEEGIRKNGKYRKKNKNERKEKNME